MRYIQILFVFLSSSLFAQVDSTESVFRNSTVTEMQWDLGYSGTQIAGHPYNGITVKYLGVVFDDKFCMGLGVDFYGTKFNVNSALSVPSDYTSLSLNYIDLEYLLRPKKILNFSFPVKFAWCKAGLFDNNIPNSSTGWFYYGKMFYYHTDQFVTIAPGLNMMLNLFKGMSIGAGGNYRFAWGVDKVGTNADMSYFSFLAFARFKLNMIEYRKRVRERQKAVLEMQQENQGMH